MDPSIPAGDETSKIPCDSMKWAWAQLASNSQGRRGGGSCEIPRPSCCCSPEYTVEIAVCCKTQRISGLSGGEGRECPRMMMMRCNWYGREMKRKVSYNTCLQIANIFLSMICAGQIPHRMGLLRKDIQDDVCLHPPEQTPDRAV